VDLEKQKLLLNDLISDYNLFVLCNSIIKPSYFDPSLKKVVAFVQEYFEKYKNIPDVDTIKTETNVTFVNKKLSHDKIKYVADEIEIFCKKKAIETALIESIPLLEKDDYGKIELNIKNAISVGLIKDLGTEYFKDPENRLMETLNTAIPISTGWPELDININGGLFRQELTLFMANSGVGKSIILSNITANVLKQKYNVVYITLELSEKIVAKRIDSMITHIAQNQILSNIPKVSSELEKIRDSYGKLFIKRMRESTTNAKHIITYLKEFQDTTGQNVDLLVIDYLDIMAPTQKISADNLFGKDKYLSEEVRAIGFDFDCAIASASQMGRAALEAEEIHQGHIQGGISKVNTVDNLISIIQTDQMRAAGEYVLSFAKTRNSAGVGKSIVLGWDPSTLTVYSLEAKKDNLKLSKNIKDDLTDKILNSESKNTNILNLVRKKNKDTGNQD
jgi:archaellum biogenesis ATPase FlaH